LGILLGNRKEEAAKFSFLLSIPAILGAAVFDLKDFAFTTLGSLNILVGILTAIVVGYVSLKFLLRMIMKKKFHLFAYYCWAAGLLTLMLNYFF
jgi:undecaprenyl-diphosphatase